MATGEPAQAIHQRSDVCAVPAAGVVAEAMVALVLADAALEKFGGDSLAETRRNLRAYLDADALTGRAEGGQRRRRRHARREQYVSAAATAPTSVLAGIFPLSRARKPREGCPASRGAARSDQARAR